MESSLRLKLPLFLLLSAALSVPPARAAALGPALESAPSSAVLGADFRLSPAQLQQRYLGAQADLGAALAAIAAVPDAQRGFDNTIKAFETASAVMSDRALPLAFLAHVSPDPAVRAAAREIEERYGELKVDLMQREDVYAAIRGYADKGEPLTGEDRRLLELTLKAFDRNGMGLTREKRAELKKVKERLAVVASQFQANIGEDASTITATRAELDGLPPDFVDGLKRENDSYILTLKYPHYRPVTALAKSEPLRKRMELAFNNRALENIPLVEETLRLRQRMAELMGERDYPAFELQNRMAKTPERVWSFLNGLLSPMRERGRAELQELLAEKKKDDPAAAAIDSWDAKYYSTRIRDQKFGFNDEEVRQYFPADRVVSGTLGVYERVLGLKFTEVPAAGAWHEDARLFRVDDAATGARLGHFFLDLHPRDGKAAHAEAFPLVTGRSLENGYNEPLSAMVTNFSAPENGRPALFKWEEVRTFFHEFGHLMHHTLTTSRYASFSGLSAALDFVEAPSQMMENFVREPEVVAELSGKWDEPEKKLPPELLAKIRAASDVYHDAGGLMTGLHYLRQLAFAMIDMTYHAAAPRRTTELFHQLYLLITMQSIPAGSHQEASFGHLQEYGAGYYGYLWSEVFADDIFSVFKKEGILGPAGMRYRRAILERGASRPEAESLADFLGRDPSPEAFTRKLNGGQAAAR